MKKLAKILSLAFALSLVTAAGASDADAGRWAKPAASKSSRAKQQSASKQRRAKPAASNKLSGPAKRSAVLQRMKADGSRANPSNVTVRKTGQKGEVTATNGRGKSQILNVRKSSKGNTFAQKSTQKRNNQGQARKTAVRGKDGKFRKSDRSGVSNSGKSFKFTDQNSRKKVFVPVNPK